MHIFIQNLVVILLYLKKLHMYVICFCVFFFFLSFCSFLCCLVCIISDEDVYMAANDATSRMCDSTLYLHYYEKHAFIMRKFIADQIARFCIRSVRQTAFFESEEKQFSMYLFLFLFLLSNMVLIRHPVCRVVLKFWISPSPIFERYVHFFLGGGGGFDLHLVLWRHALASETDVVFEFIIIRVYSYF